MDFLQSFLGGSGGSPSGGGGDSGGKGSSTAKTGLDFSRTVNSGATLWVVVALAGLAVVAIVAVALLVKRN